MNISYLGSVAGEWLRKRILVHLAVVSAAFLFSCGSDLEDDDAGFDACDLSFVFDSSSVVEDGIEVSFKSPLRRNCVEALNRSTGDANVSIEVDSPINQGRVLSVDFLNGREILTLEDEGLFTSGSFEYLNTLRSLYDDSDASVGWLLPWGIEYDVDQTNGEMADGDETNPLTDAEFKIKILYAATPELSDLPRKISVRIFKNEVVE